MRHKRQRRQVACGLAFKILLLAKTLVGQIDSQQLVMDRLLDEGKFGVAELLCRDQLTDPNLALEERAATTVELIRVLVRHAREVRGAERDDIMRTAEREAAEYLSRDRDSLQRFLVQFQAALIPRTVARLKRWESASVPEATADPEILRLIRDTRRQLDTLAEALDGELRQFRRRDPGEPGHLSQRDLRQLRARVGLEMGKTYAEQGSAYAVKSDDRVLSASQGATELLRLSPTSLSSELWMTSRFALLHCLRMKGDWPAMAKQLRTLRGMRLSKPDLALLQAELIRTAIARDDGSRLAELVAGAERESDADVNHEQDVALVEGYMALAQRSQRQRDVATMSDWQKRAAELIDQKKSYHSNLWLRRVQSLLAGESMQAVRSTRGSSQLQLHAAQAMLRQGELTTALQAYETAGRIAKSQQDLETYADIQKTMAGIEIKLQRLPAAEKRLRELAVEDARSAQAADTHLLAIKLAAANQSIDYTSLLREHVRVWPASGSSDLVRWWLVRVQEHEGKFLEAAKNCQQISLAFAGFANVLTAEERCWRFLKDVDPNADEARSAVNRFVDLSQDPALDGETRTRAAIASLRVAHHFGLTAGTPTKTLEQRMLNSGVVSDWPRDAQFALLAEYMRTDNTTKARNIIAEMEPTVAADWLHLFALVERFSPLPIGPEAARLRLEVLDSAERSPLQMSDVQRSQWSLFRCRSLVAAGRGDEALEPYRSLVRSRPGNGEIAEEYARLMSSMPAVAARDAVAAWRNVVARSRPTSARWYRAKVRLMGALIQAGDTPRAAEMAKMMEALHPDLGDERLQEQFRQVQLELRPYYTSDPQEAGP